MSDGESNSQCACRELRDIVGFRDYHDPRRLNALNRIGPSCKLNPRSQSQTNSHTRNPSQSTLPVLPSPPRSSHEGDDLQLRRVHHDSTTTPRNTTPSTIDFTNQPGAPMPPTLQKQAHFPDSDSGGDEGSRQCKKVQYSTSYGCHLCLFGSLASTTTPGSFTTNTQLNYVDGQT